MIVRPNETTADDRDVYLAIIETTTQCAPVTLQFLHVMGHQDTKSNQPLTITEQWNVECDKKAKLYVTTTKTQSTSLSNPAIPAAQPHLIINGKLLCRKLLPTLQESLSSPDYYRYLQKKLDCTPGNMSSIHWNVLRLSMDSFNHQDQRRLVLFINNKLPLRASKAHPHQGSTLCPSCRREPEDSWHFLECVHPARRDLFTGLKTNLTNATQKLSMHPCIFTAIWLGLSTIRHDTPYPNIHQDVLPQLRHPIQQQS